MFLVSPLGISATVKEYSLPCSVRTEPLYPAPFTLVASILSLAPFMVSFTSTSFNVTLPLFVTAIWYEMVSPTLYIPVSASGLEVIVFTTDTFGSAASTLIGPAISVSDTLSPTNAGSPCAVA